MGGNTFGNLFRVTTFGESHGAAVGVVVDGCPPRLPLTRRGDPARARPAAAGAERHHHAAARGGRGRDPVGRVRRAHAGHADRADGAQSGRAAAPTRRCARSSGPRTPTTRTRRSTACAAGRAAARSSARETIGRVAAGVLARKVLAASPPARDRRVRAARARPRGRRSTPPAVTTADVEANIVRCPDAATAAAMIARIDEARRAGDSLGGVVEAVRARRARRAGASRCSTGSRRTSRRRMLSLPAAKGFEIGSGFAGTLPAGRQHNDPFYQPATGGRGAPHADEPLRRRAGRHQQRRGHRVPRRLQADGDDPARAGDRRRVRAARRRSRRAAATIPASCRAPCRSSRP